MLYCEQVRDFGSLGRQRPKATRSEASNGGTQTLVGRSHRRDFAHRSEHCVVIEILFEISRYPTFLIARKIHDCPLE